MWAVPQSVHVPNMSLTSLRVSYKSINPQGVPPLLTPEAYTRSSMDERVFARVGEDYSGRLYAVAQAARAHFE